MSKIKASLTLESSLQEIEEIATKYSTAKKISSPTKTVTAGLDSEKVTPTNATSVVKKIKLNAVHTSISNPDKPLSSLNTGRLKSANEEEKKPPIKRAPEFPMTSKEAIKHFKNLNEFEIQESINFDGQIYYTGSFCKNKVKGHPIKYIAQGDKMVPSQR